MATVEQQVSETQNGATTTIAGGIPVENPATGETIATVPEMSAEQVAEMAARGRAAQPEWEAFGFEGRARVMLRAQKWIMDNAQRGIETICAEAGKTVEDAEVAETGYAGNAFGFWAKYGPEYLADERIKSSQVLVKGKKIISRYRPLGLIGVIGPWNYPLTNSFGDCIPALMAGNSVILKPSEITPLTSLLLAEGLRECGLPENAFQVATGRGETGAALIEQMDTIKAHVADAIQEGARVLTGGHQAPGAGRFFEPTVLVDVDHTMKCMTEETFGPTLPIMKVRDEDEAVRLANDSPYGLGASVFSRNTARGAAIARRVEAGAANVNDATLKYTVLAVPSGGAKASGLGSPHGAGGIRNYASQQAIVVTPKLAMKKELFMYPYKSRTSKLLAGVFKFMYGRGKRA